MKAGEIYNLTLGKYGDKYLVTGDWYGSLELRRVRLPKTKIDSIRLPERITITHYGSSIQKDKNSKK